MALEDRNLEEINTRTTINRDDLSLVRNVLSHLDNGVSFGNSIKQIFANMIQSDITGSTGYDLLETDISENVRANILVENAESAQRVEDGYLIIEESLNSVSFLPVRTGITTRYPVTSAALELDYLMSISCGDWSLVLVDMGSSSIAGGRNPLNLYTVHTDTSGGFYNFHYSKSQDVMWMTGINRIGILADDDSDLTLSFTTRATQWGMADNRKTVDYDVSDIKSSGIFLMLQQYTSVPATMMMKYNLGPTSGIPSGVYGVTFAMPTGGGIQSTIAYSPTLDTFVTGSADGYGLILTVDITSPPSSPGGSVAATFLTAAAESNLQCKKVSWAKDSFFALDDTDTGKRTTDLSTWTTLSFPTGSGITNVIQMDCYDGEDSDCEWFLLLGTSSEVYFTRDFTTYYKRKVGESDTEWRDASKFNEGTMVLLGNKGRLAVLTYNTQMITVEE